MGALGCTEWYSQKRHSGMTSKHLLFPFFLLLILLFWPLQWLTQYHSIILHMQICTFQQIIHTWSPHECFSPSSPFPQPYPAPPSQTAAPETTKTPARGNRLFPFFFFRLCCFRLDSWSPWRGAVRGAQVGSQAGRKVLVSGEEQWWAGGRAGMCRTHLSQTLEGRSNKTLDNKWIQLFTFVILQ